MAMRRLLVLLAVVGSMVAASLPVMADQGGGAFVYVTHPHEDIWSFHFQHQNPCTGNWPDVTWEAEHRSMLVDRDGDLSTITDQMKNPKVMNILWAIHPEDGWVVTDVGDSLTQSDWDEILRFDDVDQATVTYRVWVRAENPTTGQSYQVRSALHWVSNGQGETVHGVDNTTNHATPCRSGPAG